MDLLSIARKMWRHKLATVPVIVLTICGVAYVLAVKAPLYEASSSYVLINPPAAPTADEIARNPALGRIKADNPYTRFTDQSVVIDVLARTAESDAARKALVRAGADPRYMVTSGATFGSSSPIVQITGTGPSPQAAIGTATVVGRAVTNELDRIQKVREVDPEYRITTLQIDAPDDAKLQSSGKLRMLIGVLGLGVIMLFVIVSVTDALDKLRVERAQRMALAGLAAGQDESRSAHGGPSGRRSRLVAENRTRPESDGLSNIQSIDLDAPSALGSALPSNGRATGTMPSHRQEYQDFDR
jgi:capsular polysaccharide biosynthesis protein